MNKNVCPNCGSKEFVTEPYQYDVMVFNGETFDIVSTEQIDDFKIFCRECSSEVKISNISKNKVISLN